MATILPLDWLLPAVYAIICAQLGIYPTPYVIWLWIWYAQSCIMVLPINCYFDFEGQRSRSRDIAKVKVILAIFAAIIWNPTLKWPKKLRPHVSLEWNVYMYMYVSWYGQSNAPMTSEVKGQGHELWPRSRSIWAIFSVILWNHTLVSHIYNINKRK